MLSYGCLKWSNVIFFIFAQYWLWSNVIFFIFAQYWLWTQKYEESRLEFDGVY